MPKFSYKALDARGCVKSGVIEATDRNQANLALSRQDLKVQRLDLLRDPTGGPAAPTLASRDSGVLSRPPAQAAPARDSGVLSRPPAQAAPARDSGVLSRPPAQAAPARDSGVVSRPPAPVQSRAAALSPRLERLRKPLIFSLIALGLAMMGWSAVRGRPASPVAATSAPASVKRPVTISGRLPNLPQTSVVAFHFPEAAVTVERSPAELKLGPDGSFQVELEVDSPTPPQTFQVEARAPGRKLRSPSLSLGGTQTALSGVLVGELTPVENARRKTERRPESEDDRKQLAEKRQQMRRQRHQDRKAQNLERKRGR